jgi:hypothetical protein
MRKKDGRTVHKEERTATNFNTKFSFWSEKVIGEANEAKNVKQRQAKNWSFVSENKAKINPVSLRSKRETVARYLIHSTLHYTRIFTQCVKNKWIKLVITITVPWDNDKNAVLMTWYRYEYHHDNYFMLTWQWSGVVIMLLGKVITRTE